MRPAYAVSLAAAVGCHALLLFGFKLGTSATPLAVSDDSSPIDVSLVASAAPDSPPAEPAAPPEPASTPEPAPTPVPPMPQPTPEMSTPPPEPAPAPSQPADIAPATAPQISRETPPPHPRVQKHSRTIATSPGATTLQGATLQGGGASGPPGTAARYRSNPRPPYPEEARRLREEGVVLLSVEVSAEGRATDVSLKHTSGSDLLDQAAIQAVKRWTFEPARVASMPVASRVDVPIRFSLSQ